MRGLIMRAAVVAGAVVVLLGLAVGVASATGAAGPGPATGTRALSGATWGMAKEVPGTAALNKGGNASINSVSCASAGNCSAGGQYKDSSGHLQAFVVSQVHGVWGKAEEVPGTAALNQGGNGGVGSVSCASAGNCSAGGGYAVNSGGVQALQVFVVSQVHGIWGKAKQVPGTAALNQGGFGVFAGVSCGSPGNCSAGGDYVDGSGGFQVFVVSQVHGIWGKAKEVPGTAALNPNGNASITAVSCGSAGNCSTGGTVTGNSAIQAFVVSQVNGTWGKAEVVPGTAALNKDGNASTTAISCASAGNCSLGGFYADSSFHGRAFVVSQVHGIWGKAKQVPGFAALDQGSSGSLGEVGGVSCASAGNCSAGGNYVDSSGHSQAFVVSQVHGIWGKAKEVPGTAGLNQGGNASITAVSCASAGNCSAGGFYKDSSGHQQAFVVSQT